MSRGPAVPRGGPVVSLEEALQCIEEVVLCTDEALNAHSGCPAVSGHFSGSWDVIIPESARRN